MNFNYYIEFPLTCKAFNDIKNAFDMEFTFYDDCHNAFLFDNNNNIENAFFFDYYDDIENPNIYCIQIYDLFWYNDCVIDHDPESSGALKFNQLNIPIIKNIMTKICDIIQKYEPFQDFKINDCVVHNSITNQSNYLLSKIKN